MMNNAEQLLEITTYATIHCGLRWDPSEDASESQADLDLVYATYDEFGRLIQCISGKDEVKFSEAGSIYHSGDDADGADDADDERVTLNLAGMPQDVHYIFLMVDVYSNHTFGNVRDPHIRLSAGVSREDFVREPISGEDARDSKAFLFVRLDRVPGGWKMSNIARHVAWADAGLVDWPRIVEGFLPSDVDFEAKARDLPAVPGKGQAVKLFYTPEANHRVICGLGWDVPEGRDEIYDLDLTCIMFGEDDGYYDYVGVDRVIDESSSVYHTGDNDSGDGIGDDEQISVELRKVPEAVRKIVFVAEVQGEQNFSDVLRPQIRIADGMTNRDQLSVQLAQDKPRNAYVFCCLYKHRDSWMLRFVDSYIDANAIDDWAEAVKPHLS